MKISFSVPGRPVPWARSGQNGKRHFTPPKQSAAMKVVANAGFKALAGRPLIRGPIQMRIVFAYQWPETMRIKYRRKGLDMPTNEYMVGKPDADNLVKLVKDALKEVVWTDDCLVVSLHAWKVYSDQAETRVEIVQLREPEPIAVVSVSGGKAAARAAAEAVFRS